MIQADQRIAGIPYRRMRLASSPVTAWYYNITLVTSQTKLKRESYMFIYYKLQMKTESKLAHHFTVSRRIQQEAAADQWHCITMDSSFSLNRNKWTEDQRKQWTEDQRKHFTQFAVDWVTAVATVTHCYTWTLYEM